MKRYEAGEQLLTPEEVAHRLGVTRRSVYSWLKSGELKGLRAGRGWRIRIQDLAAYLEGGPGASEFADYIASGLLRLANANDQRCRVCWRDQSDLNRFVVKLDEESPAGDGQWGFAHTFRQEHTTNGFILQTPKLHFLKSGKAICYFCYNNLKQTDGPEIVHEINAEGNEWPDYWSEFVEPSEWDQH